MFEQAKKNAPCIIFIDEIDAVGRHRGAGLGGGNDEREQTLNQLLVEMDGFEANEGIILIAATNRPDVLDPALLRPGRFDRQVVVPNPDVVGREQILKVHVRKVPLAPDVNLKTIARGTPGFSGADLANLVNEAALMAARRNKRMVTQAEFEDAKDKVMMGAERKSLVMTEEEKMLTAYHEGGHAIVALNVKATDPVHKATIIPRGRALGMVMQLPERDKLSMSFEQMTSRLAIMMGGRVAEEMIFGKEKVTSGAQSDIEQATRLARMMVTRWGFSTELGAVAYGENQDEVFLGMSVARTQNVSEATAQKIDAEVRRLVEDGARRGAPDPRRQARRSRNAGQGPARVRDAVRRRDQGPARRQAAEPRVGDRAAARRARPRCRRPARAARGRGRKPARWSRSRRLEGRLVPSSFVKPSVHRPWNWDVCSKPSGCADFRGRRRNVLPTAGIQAGRLNPSGEKQYDENDQDDADDANAAVTEAVSGTREAPATKASEKKNNEDDNEDGSERHDRNLRLQNWLVALSTKTPGRPG